MAMRSRKTAEAGLGTLILFIAFIVVASIAAAVLINTAGSLQSKALETGTRTQKQVSSGISVLTIYGENSSFIPQVNYIYATIKLIPGGDPVVLNSSFLSVFSGTMSASYNFNQSGNCSSTWLSNTSLSTDYYAIEVEKGFALAGILQEGDVAMTCVKLPSGINESQKITWEFSPKNGAFTRIKTETPNVMSTAKVYLFP